MGFQSFSGQCEKPYVPEGMVGLSAKSAQPAEAQEFIRMMFSPEVQGEMYGGFPVNREAFEARFDFLEPGDSNGSMILPGKDGTEEELELLWPSAEKEQAFTELVKGLRTPVEEQDWLSDLVYEEGLKVLEEEESPGEAAEEIARRAAIYLAE